MTYRQYKIFRRYHVATFFHVVDDIRFSSGVLFAMAAAAIMFYAVVQVRWFTACPMQWRRSEAPATVSRCPAFRQAVHRRSIRYGMAMEEGAVKQQKADSAAVLVFLNLASGDGDLRKVPL